MKTLPLTLLLASALTATAQQPEIIGFADDGSLTWTNGIAGGYCSVESKFDLGFIWYPFTTDTWSQASSSCVQSCKLDLAIFDKIDIPIPEIEALTHRSFFRLLVSSNEIPLPVVTNTLRVDNGSSGTLSNIVVGAIVDWSRSPVTNIPTLSPSATSDWMDVTIPFVFTITALASGSNVVGYSDGWYLAYQQNGTNRNLEMPMLAIGPARKEIVAAVSNNSVTTTWTWLNWGGTKTW